MKITLIILLAIGSIASAKPPAEKKPLEPFPVADAFDVRSISKEDILATIRHKNAIIAEQKVELDSAKADVETFRSKAEDADTQVVSAQGETAVIQKSMDDLRAWGLDQEKQKQEAQSALEIEHKARVSADAHVSRIKTWMGFSLGAVLVLLVQYLPWSLIFSPWSIYGRVAASAAALGLGWFIVARFV